MTPLLTLGLLLSTPARADLDVAFVLDTTGSMSGEIREAKTRVQELSQALRAARPGETIRIGVVAYRDLGDAYLTLVSPLDADLAPTQRFLAELEANGGGDGPEDVREGLRVALQELQWSQAAEKQVFLIADAPAHTDYTDVPTLEALADEANTRRIVINAIGCRSLSPEGITQFRTLAYGTEGQYHHIGRVEADAGGLADAMLQTLAPAPAPDGPLTSLAVYPSQDRPASAAPGPFEGGVLVRLGDWLNPLARVPEQPGQACSLSVMLPPGMALSAPPQVGLGAARMHVQLTLGAGPGVRSVWELERCVPASTPVETVLN